MIFLYLGIKGNLPYLPLGWRRLTRARDKKYLVQTMAFYPSLPLSSYVPTPIKELLEKRQLLRHTSIPFLTATFLDQKD